MGRRLNLVEIYETHVDGGLLSFEDIKPNLNLWITQKEIRTHYNSYSEKDENYGIQGSMKFQFDVTGLTKEDLKSKVKGDILRVTYKNRDDYRRFGYSSVDKAVYRGITEKKEDFELEFQITGFKLSNIFCDKGILTIDFTTDDPYYAQEKDVEIK